VQSAGLARHIGVSRRGRLLFGGIAVFAGGILLAALSPEERESGSMQVEH
jgi:hypothetical protein